MGLIYAAEDQHFFQYWQSRYLVQRHGFSANPVLNLPERLRYHAVFEICNLSEKGLKFGRLNKTNWQSFILSTVLRCKIRVPFFQISIIAQMPLLKVSSYRFKLAVLAGLILLLKSPLVAQEGESGFGVAPQLNISGPCLLEEDRQLIREKIKQSLLTLNLSSDRADEDILFQTPVRQSSNYDDEGVIAISNFVDHNAAFPDLIQDYSCSSRTYDTQNGYNHQGTDLYSWPFAWSKMNNDHVEVVAAAAGTIILKEGGEYDKSCTFNSNDWNAIYLRHSDGSVAWYGHLKQNSLTSKVVGQEVQAGEFLGVIGSSGNSTGPHLHFEVYDAANNLIDPYNGNCNPTTDRSWWLSQEPYRVPMINKLMTNSSPATFGCYEEEATNQEVNFVSGQQAFFTTFFRDQLTSLTSTHELVMPNGSVYQQWTTTPTENFDGSWWYRSFNLPASGSLGKWTFRVNYNGKTYNEHFYLTSGSGNVDLSFSTSQLVFEDVEPGSVATKSFTITNNGDAGLIVHGIAYPSSFSGNWNGLVHAEDSKEIKVTFSPLTETNFSGQLAIRTNIGDLTLPIVASFGCSDVNRSVALGICQGDSYTFGNQTLTEEGSYSHTFQTPAGCDSLVNLTLSLIEPVTQDVSLIVCEGDTYTFGTRQINTAGTYTETFQSLAGCDSTVNLTLDFTSIDLMVTKTEGTLSVAESGASYQWFDCSDNTPVANATSKSFTPSFAGEYKVVVTKADCELISECVRVDVVLGIEQNEISEDLRVYPNPGKDRVTVDFGEVSVNGTYELIGITGNKMISGDLINKKSFEIILDIPEGMYFLRITDKKGRRSVINLIKQR